jgi:phage terminase Nu1 subunit (DNA packaging protein)
LYPAVKAWFESERAHGNYVDKADLASEFVRVAQEVALRLEQQSQGRQLSKKANRMLGILKERLDSLRNRRANRKLLSNELQMFCKARLLKPHRIMNLSMAE